MTGHRFIGRRRRPKDRGYSKPVSLAQYRFRDYSSDKADERSLLRFRFNGVMAQAQPMSILKQRRHPDQSDASDISPPWRHTRYSVRWELLAVVIIHHFSRDTIHRLPRSCAHFALVFQIGTSNEVLRHISSLLLDLGAKSPNCCFTGWNGVMRRYSSSGAFPDFNKL